MDNKKNTIVVSAFPGKGKTYAYRNQDKYVISDSDSSKFSWVWEDGVQTSTRNPDFITDYMNHIQHVIDDGKTDVIFVSSHSEVRAALKERGIKYFLIYAYYDEKDEHLDTYRKRGNSENFIKRMDENYYKYIEEMDKETYPIKIKLHYDEFITTELLDDLTNYGYLWAASCKQYLESDHYTVPLEKLNWTKICYEGGMGTSMLNKFKEYLDPDTLYMYQNVPEKFAHDYIHTIPYMLKYQHFSKDFKTIIKGGKVNPWYYSRRRVNKKQTEK